MLFVRGSATLNPSLPNTTFKSPMSTLNGRQVHHPRWCRIRCSIMLNGPATSRKAISPPAPSVRKTPGISAVCEMMRHHAMMLKSFYWARRDSNPHEGYPSGDFKSPASAIPPLARQCRFPLEKPVSPLFSSTFSLGDNAAFRPPESTEVPVSFCCGAKLGAKTSLGVALSVPVAWPASEFRGSNLGKASTAAASLPRETCVYTFIVRSIVLCRSNSWAVRG